MQPLHHDHPQPSDEILLALARRRDRPDAQRLLRDRLAPLLVHEVGSDVFAALLTSDKQVDDLRAFLGGAITKRRLHEQRTAANRARLRNRHAPLLREQLDHGDDRLMLGELDRDAAISLVRDAIPLLPDEERVIIEDRLRGLALPEIAAKLGVPHKVVSRRNDRAIAWLKRQLGHIDGPFRGEALATSTGVTVEACIIAIGLRSSPAS